MNHKHCCSASRSLASCSGSEPRQTTVRYRYLGSDKKNTVALLQIVMKRKPTTRVGEVYRVKRSRKLVFKNTFLWNIFWVWVHLVLCKEKRPFSIIVKVIYVKKKKKNSIIIHISVILQSTDNGWCFWWRNFLSPMNTCYKTRIILWVM